MKHIRFLLLLLLVIGCRENSLEPYTVEKSEQKYVYRYVVFSKPSEWDSTTNFWKWVDTEILISVNGWFFNTSNKAYAAFPRTKLRYKDSGEIYRIFDGGLGVTASEDWSQFIKEEDRFQPLVIVYDTIQANSWAKIKVLTGFFYIPKEPLTVELVFVINGKETKKSPLRKVLSPGS